jgi:hypothetical protein
VKKGHNRATGRCSAPDSKTNEEERSDSRRKGQPPTRRPAGDLLGGRDLHRSNHGADHPFPARRTRGRWLHWNGNA